MIERYTKEQLKYIVYLYKNKGYWDDLSGKLDCRECPFLKETMPGNNTCYPYIRYQNSKFVLKSFSQQELFEALL